MSHTQTSISKFLEELDHLHKTLSITETPKEKLDQIVEKLKSIVKQLYEDADKRNILDDIKHKYEFIANNAKEFMSLINREFKYEAVNDSYCFAHNKKRDEIIGKSLADLWGKSVFNKTIRNYINDCFSGKEIQYEEWFQFPALGKRYFDVHYYPYYGKDATVTHAVVITHDITQRKNAEIKLKKHQNHLEEMVRDRTQELEESNQKLQTEILERKRLEERQAKLIDDLKNALQNVKRLEGLIPICANCKKIRDDKGYWAEVDSYIRDHSDAEFTHGICPDCMLELYPEFAHKQNNRDKSSKQEKNEHPTTNSHLNKRDRKT